MPAVSHFISGVGDSSMMRSPGIKFDPVIFISNGLTG